MMMMTAMMLMVGGGDDDNDANAAIMISEGRGKNYIYILKLKTHL
jgi:hypothetical protein